MPAIALLASPGKLLGFLLLANPSAVTQAPATSDCIFTGVPSEASLLNHELSQFIQSSKNMEYQCEVKNESQGHVIVVRSIPNTAVELRFASNGVGTWSVMRDGKQSVEGMCEFAVQKNG